MRRPRLSVVCKTANSGDRLARWVALTRRYADELVVLVDDSSADNTAELAERLADRTATFEHPPVAERVHDAGLRMATGEWVLLLDDDEVMAEAFPALVGDLFDDPYVTHYWLPYRWVVDRGHRDYGWLRTFPWHPNPRLRLIRNVGSIFADRGRLHAPIDVAGAGRVLNDDAAAMYHLDLALRDRGAREAKVLRYRGHNAPSCEEYYLWEDYRATLDIVTVDDPVVEVALGCDPAGLGAIERGPAAVGPALTAAEQRASAARHWRTADVFHAEYLGSTMPARVLANRGYTVEVRLRNTSSLRWRNTGTTDGRVSLSYHWVHPEHGMLVRDGDVALLPDELDPGQETTLQAGVWTPYDPGRYRLEWDLRAEGVNWFSERGVAPLVTQVEVDAHDRLLERRRAVAALPRRAKAMSGRRRLPSSAGVRSRLREWNAARSQASLLASANVVPIPVVRVLDTRDGTGFPGAPHGPLRGGAVVTMRVTGLAGGIPDTAVGVVGTLSVPYADFNGFITAYPADGTSGTGAVSAYFDDTGRPSATQVLVSLGTGDHAGQLSLHVSDSHAGTLQLLLDVVAYLD